MLLHFVDLEAVYSDYVIMNLRNCFRISSSGFFSSFSVKINSGTGRAVCF